MESTVCRCRLVSKGSRWIKMRSGCNAEGRVMSKGNMWIDGSEIWADGIGTVNWWVSSTSGGRR